MISVQQRELVQWLRKNAEDQRLLGRPWRLKGQVDLLDSAEERRHGPPANPGAERFLREWSEVVGQVYGQEFKVNHPSFAKEDWPPLADQLADWLEHETKIRDTRLWRYL